MTARTRLIAATALVAALAGCRGSGDIVVDEGVGITAVRTACPAVGIPDYTGDITTFRTPGATDAGSIDVTAAITNLRTQCNEAGEKVYSTSTFDVVARRADVRGARTVQLPYFVTVLRGRSAVVSKRLGTVTLNFADGQERAQARGQGAAYIDKAEATLAEEIRREITRKRKAGDADAATDPLSRPEIRAAVNRATFEVLVGFQLDQNQLSYNATR
ncbi:hypothetical protein [Novosphingobium sp. TH158]|uniref:hypothetical protein n=1 Tax=Novosphingobium sp. TH158 TaxID=2067455 RepID=UPI000C7B7C2C|nr:hypothetical protein [Novosphingobium sp. TH158]PLK25494.1 hypothetical protein C0V78_00255 [Novosphingobium sp. TH158]